MVGGIGNSVCIGIMNVVEIGEMVVNIGFDLDLQIYIRFNSCGFNLVLIQILGIWVRFEINFFFFECQFYLLVFF